MKSFINILLVIVLLGTAPSIIAQNQVFSLVSHDQQPRAVSVQNGALVAQMVNSKAIDKTEQFILKRHVNGNVLIASAAHPDMCFKYTGTSVTLEKYDGNVAAFEWKIEYVEEDQYLFRHASLKDYCLSIDEQNTLSVLPITQMRKKRHFGCCLFMLVQEEYPF